MPSFIRRMISLLSHSYHPYHHIHLTRQFRADFCWWHTFLPVWNGVFVLPPMFQSSACFASDASGQWGCGARWDARWFQFRWPQSALTYHISFLELVAVLMACTVWGPIICHSIMNPLNMAGHQLKLAISLKEKQTAE